MSVTDVNMAASEMVSQKVRDVESDVLDKSVENDLQTVLETVKEFCIKTKRTNAFLSEIRSDNKLYRPILELVDMRLIHVYK